MYFLDVANIEIHIYRRPLKIGTFVLHSFSQLELFSAHIDFNRQKSCTKVSKLSSCVIFSYLNFGGSPVGKQNNGNSFKDKLLLVLLSMSKFYDILPQYYTYHHILECKTSPFVICYRLDCIWKLIISI